MLSSLSSSLGRSQSNQQQSMYPQLPGLSNQGNTGMQPSSSYGYGYNQPASTYGTPQGGAGGPSSGSYQSQSQQGQIQPYNSGMQPSGSGSGSASGSGFRFGAGGGGGGQVQQQSQQQQQQPAQQQQMQGWTPNGTGASWGVGRTGGYGLVYPAGMNVLATRLQPQQLETVRPDEDPVYGALGRARGKVERGMIGDVEISPDLAELIVPSNVAEKPYVDLPSPAPAFRPIRITKSLPLPDALMQELNYKHLTAKMGLFEEIDRAWFAVDNRLFLWDYTDGARSRDFSRYDEQAETIMSVGLVKAKKDVFVDDITHVLIICTSTKVTLLGLSRSSPRELNLYATNLSASLPTPMLEINGTEAGRVFMRGANKDLYELEYSSESGWLFGSGAKVNVINRSNSSLAVWIPVVFGSDGKEGIESFVVDTSAGRLFTLHTKGQIELYDISGTNFQLRSRYDRLQADLKMMSERLTGSTQLEPQSYRIVSIDPVGLHESQRTCLVATAANGIRAYFSTSYFAQPMLRAPPQGLHMKLETASTCSSGTFFAVQKDTSQPTTSSILHVFTPHSGKITAVRENGIQDPFAGQLHEWCTSDSIGSEVWTIAEMPSTSPARSPPSLSRQDGIALSSLARQATTEARSFVILATSGIYFAVQSRPIDMLSGTLESERDATVDVVRDSFGKIQLAAMAVTLGSRANIQNQDLGSSLSQIMLNFQAPVVENGPTGRTITYSPRHDGFALTLARFLRPIWDIRVTRLAAPGKQILGCAEGLLLQTQQRLEQLRRYIEENPFPGSQAEGDVKVAWDQEELSLDGLRKLLKQAVEAISFMLLLNDYRISEIIARCDPAVQSTLGNMLWKDLFTSVTGKDVAKRLVTALIEQQIGQELGIDTLSEILQQRCGSFVQPGDVVLYKAEESMRRAESSRDPIERSESLSEATRLYSRAASNILPRLPEITKRMRAQQYAPGAIELALQCASDIDPQDKASDYVHDGRHPQDPRKALHDQRMECYSCVIEALAMYDQMLDSAVSQNTGGADAASAKRDEAYALAINSNDELFHFYLYDWHVSRNLQEQLLEFDTPYIETYLKLTSSDIEDRRDLLWKFYARREEYILAARALFDLATRQSPMILEDRAYYLAQALTSAKSAASLGADDVEFTSSIQERMDVAQVQQEVARGIENHPELNRTEKDEVLGKLNSNLLGLDELYQTFARPFRLYEPILLILKTADTRVDDVCEAVWTELLAPLSPAAKAERIFELCRRYFPSEAAPLDIVIPVIYASAFGDEAGPEEGWATRAMVEGGIPMRDCWEVVMTSHDQAGTDEEREFYAEEAGVLAELWINDRDAIPLAEIERFVSAYVLRTQAAQPDERKRRTRERMNRAKGSIGKW